MVSRPARECQVVVCDDQEAFRQVVTVVLNLEPGVEVVGEAADGREAIRIARELRPDVLTLDIAMPVMDGLEALPLIREASPETQIVMLTGLVSNTIRQRAVDAGACLFIEKGTDVQAIAGQIRGVCSKPAGV